MAPVASSTAHHVRSSPQFGLATPKSSFITPPARVTVELVTSAAARRQSSSDASGNQPVREASSSILVGVQLPHERFL